MTLKRDNGFSYNLLKNLSTGHLNILVWNSPERLQGPYVKRQLLLKLCNLGQLKKLFGVKTESEGFIGKIVDICKGLDNANWYDFGVGMGSIAMLVLLKDNSFSITVLKLFKKNFRTTKLIVQKRTFLKGT